jgi:hypothetical protein
MKESRRSCPRLRNTLLPRFLANATLAKGFGNNHAPTRAQDSPFHSLQKPTFIVMFVSYLLKFPFIFAVRYRFIRLFSPVRERRLALRDPTCPPAGHMQAEGMYP